jgi:glycosyltransferase 2 family protein
MMPVPSVFRNAAIALLGVDAVAIAILVAMATAPERFRALVGGLLARWPRLQRRAVGAFSTFARGIDGVRHPGHVVPLLAWTVVVWVFPALAAWTMLRALDIQLPWLAGWTVLAFVGLSVSLPSAPGYIGVYHYAATLAVSLFGVANAPATAYALLSHAASFVPVTIVGWLYLLHEHLSLGEARGALPLEKPPA